MKTAGSETVRRSPAEKATGVDGAEGEWSVQVQDTHCAEDSNEACVCAGETRIAAAASATTRLIDSSAERVLGGPKRTGSK